MIQFTIREPKDDLMQKSWENQNKERQHCLMDDKL